MPDTETELPRINFKPLSDEPGGAFRCGVSEIDKWFKNCWKKHLAFKYRVTVAFLEGEEKPAGFYALCIRVEDEKVLLKHERQWFGGDRGKFIALGFEYVAVRKDLQKRGLGTIITGKVISDFANIAESCGISMMIGSAITMGAFEGFYREMGFKQYGVLNLHQPQMFLPAESAVELVRQHSS